MATDSRIEFLEKNGTLLGITSQQFSRLKGLDFDATKHNVIFSDMVGSDEYIYQISLKEQNKVYTLAEKLEDDVRVHVFL